MLEVRSLNASYDFLQVLWDVTFDVGEGELVALLGPNGAGKSTTLHSIAGLLRPIAGEVRFRGEDITGQPAHRAARQGIALVSEGGNLFAGMSVRENLLLGAYTVTDKARREDRLTYVLDLFPRLAERRTQLAATMSGGERKMLAIARALMAEPALLLIDEPSLGLAPKVTQHVYETLQHLNSEGSTILLVEQNVHSTLEIAQRAYVLEHGRVALEGRSADLLADEHIQHVYLGIS